MRRTMASTLCFSLGVTVAACAATPTDEGAAALSEAIQRSNLSYASVSAMGYGPDVGAQHATGTVFAASLDANGAQQYTADGTAIRFSCGITFIAPSYAVTAGHCVAGDSVIDTNRDRVTVQMYKPQPNGVPWGAAEQLSGAWSTTSWGITHGRIPDYESMVDRFTCRVVVRCGTANGTQINCNDPTGDVALVRCDTPVTSKGYGYLAVAQSDNPSIEPFMRWTHEIYADPPAGTLATDFLNHYSIRGAYAGNLHYFGAKNGIEYNQLVQLESTVWRNGDLFTPHKKVTPVTGADVVWTDVPGCHGSSGSGMLQLNQATLQYELLGPIALGNAFVNQYSNDLLCHDASLVRPGQQLIAYASLAHVQAVAPMADDCKYYGNWFPNNTCHAACGTQNPDGCQPGLSCVSGACVCVPLTCAGGSDCGRMSDGCGGTLDCGGCSAPLKCIANSCERPLVCPRGTVNCGDYCAAHGTQCQ